VALVSCIGSVSCTDTSTDTGQADTAFQPEFYGVTHVGYMCDREGWWLDAFVNTHLDPFGATFWMVRTEDGPAGYAERHLFPTTAEFDGEDGDDTRGYVSFDVDGWEHPYMELDIVESVPEVVEGQSTVFACDLESNAGVTFAINISMVEGFGIDCVSWGHDPTGDYDATNFSSCRQL